MTQLPQHRHSCGLWRWHRWIGLLALVFLLLAAFSGSLLVYKKPLIKWLMAPNANLPGSYSINQMQTQLQNILTLYPEETRRLIKAPNTEEPYWTLTGLDGSIQLLSRVSLEPIQVNNWLLTCLSFLRELHVNLLAGFNGEVALLISGIAGFFLSITGLILWWPTRKSFRLKWIFPRPFKLNFLIHYHRHAGALIALASLIVLFTGSVMLWQKTVRPLLPPVETTTLTHTFKTTPPDYSQLLAIAHSYIPDGWPTYIRMPAVENSEASIRFRLPGEWHPNGRTSVIFQTGTNKIAITTRSDKVPLARKLINQLYPLHSAYGLNGVYTLVIFINGVGIGWLAITGGVNYLRRPGRLTKR